MSRESDDNDKKELTELQKKKIQAEISKIDDDIEKKEKRKKIIEILLLTGVSIASIAYYDNLQKDIFKAVHRINSSSYF